MRDLIEQLLSLAPGRYLASPQSLSSSLLLLFLPKCRPAWPIDSFGKLFAEHDGNDVDEEDEGEDEDEFGSGTDMHKCAATRDSFGLMRARHTASLCNYFSFRIISPLSLLSEIGLSMQIEKAAAAAAVSAAHTLTRIKRWSAETWPDWPLSLPEHGLMRRRPRPASVFMCQRQTKGWR